MSVMDEIAMLREENGRLRAALLEAALIVDRVAVEANPRAYQTPPKKPPREPDVDLDPRAYGTGRKNPPTFFSVVENQSLLAVHSSSVEMCRDICKLAAGLGVDTSACRTQR